jgi:hypothetical protein
MYLNSGYHGAKAKRLLSLSRILDTFRFPYRALQICISLRETA